MVFTMSSLEIDLNTLEASGRDCEFSLDSEWLRGAMSEVRSVVSSDTDKGRVMVRVQRNGDEILVYGRVEASIQLTCVRSLDEFTHSVDVPISALFAPRGSKISTVGDEMELSSGDCERDEYSGNKLKLDGIVREHIILEIPMNPTCVGPDEGLKVPAHMGVDAFEEAEVSTDAQQKSSGASASVDPRLAPLQELARMMGQNKE